MTRWIPFSLALLLAAALLAPTRAWAEEEEEAPPFSAEELKQVADMLTKAADEGELYTKEEVEKDGKKEEVRKPYFEVVVEGDGIVVNGTNDGADYEWEATYAKKKDGDQWVIDEDSLRVDMELPSFFVTSNLWIMLAGCLVFIMHLGFACVESGLTRAKNTVNILFKNTMIVMIGIVMYGVCGWLIMYPGDSWIIGDVFAFGFGISDGGKGSADWISNVKNNTPFYNDGYTVWTDFFFQAMFCATCCTIVSGAVAGRVKLLPFLIFCALFTGILYPVTGSWEWGKGWLDDMGFADFAGSTLVHAVGGAGALAGALVLGPRIGKYARDGSVQPIPGHSMPLVTIGVFLLWFGWFGFNGGSELTANPEGVSWVLTTTTMAACGGGIACAGMSWIMGGKPDLSMALNGILAGLVGITAGPDVPSWVGALIICGVVPGVLCYYSVLFFDKLKIDDPVGAISVHGVCGIYGTLAVAFSGGFDGGQFVVQLIGTLSCFGLAFVFAFVVFSVLKAAMGLRVSEHEEIEGLDLGEHDMAAYPDFQQTYIKSYHAREI